MTHRNNALMEVNKIHQGDSLSLLKKMASNSVNTIVTSPPYWGLRDYGTAQWEGGDENCDHRTFDNDIENAGEKQKTNIGSNRTFKDVCMRCGAVRIDSQLGLEKTPEDYVAKVVEVFRECRRVLTKDGTLWLNLGDSYMGGGGWNGVPDDWQGISASSKQERFTHKKQHSQLKPKDLVGIPWRVAFALQADGWWLRQDIIWNKRNPMPESVTDRCTKSHEYVFLLSKSGEAQYWTNSKTMRLSSVKPAGTNGVEGEDWEWVSCRSCNGNGCKSGRCVNGKVKSSFWSGHDYFYDADAIKQKSVVEGHVRLADKNKYIPSQKINGIRKDVVQTEFANKRSVWTVSTKPFSGFSETYHWVLLGQDEPSDGNLHIMSVNCPNYGGLFDLVASVLSDEHEGDLLNHILSKYNYLSLEPKDGFVPIEQLHALQIGGQSLDSFLRKYLFSAKHHNTGIHKTDLFASTMFPCMPSDERTSRIERILTEHGLFVLNHDNAGNNTLSDGFPCNHKPQTVHYIAGKLKLDAVSYGQRYKKITKKTDHFATFPEDLIVDMIKAGCPEYVCNKCGKPREKIIEHDPIISKEAKRVNRERNDGCTVTFSEIFDIVPTGPDGLETMFIKDPLKVIGLTDCGCNAGFSPGIVLDPFMGAGTTALVSRKLHRNFIGCELNPEYIEIANKRLSSELGMFL